jgi:succinate dehydrogenase/fumarate reductase flavoprotein subunit
MKVSGAGGAGIDHWHDAYGNPCCTLEIEDLMALRDKEDPYNFTFVQYIALKESYDGLLDLEEMGMPIRDVNDEFEGAEFRDEETKLMFAYDYEGKHVLRVPGARNKEFLYAEMLKLGVTIHDFVMVTSLLSEDAKIGGRIVGAVGFNVQTGEFNIYKSKATILSTAKPLRIWNHQGELAGTSGEHDDPNSAGDGCSLGYKAGAQLAMLEKTMPSTGGYRYPCYGTGNAHNTWFPCNLVDAEGKPIPWVDRDGNIIKDYYDRLKPAEGQKTFLHGPGHMPRHMRGPSLIPDLTERIMNGEYKLPFYADLPSMPKHERRAIWGLMVGHEGKTKVPVYEAYGAAGFDPDKHLLQANVVPPEFAGKHMPWWTAPPNPQYRETDHLNSGGLVVDWNLRTTIEGLYAAGEQIPSNRGHAGAATTGRYAGRTAAEYAKTVANGNVVRQQIDDEKERIYAPVKIDEGLGWKEIQMGLCRIMQQYCGEYKSKELLEMGIWWINSVREDDMPRGYAMNPHELMRLLECEVRATVGELMMETALARKESNRKLNFKRTDYTEENPQEYDQFLTITLDENGKAKANKIPFDFWIKAPYSADYEENYQKHAKL